MAGRGEGKTLLRWLRCRGTATKVHMYQCAHAREKDSFHAHLAGLDAVVMVACDGMSQALASSLCTAMAHSSMSRSSSRMSLRSCREKGFRHQSLFAENSGVSVGRWICVMARPPVHCLKGQTTF